MDGLVLPDLTKPESKEIKKEKKKINKVYAPFLMKFFSSEGIFTKAISQLNDMLLTQLIKLIDVVRALLTNNEDKDKEDKKEKEPDSEKKKKSWIVDKWQKIIKSKFFQSVLGFLKRMATESFLTGLVGFLILLRMGIFQRFIPLLFGLIKDAILGLIGFLPTLAKMAWKLLTETIPSILKEVFRSLLKMVGIDNEAVLKFFDFIAQWLPLFVAAIGLLTTLMPILEFVGGIFSKLFTVVEAIWSIIQIISLVTGVAVGWVILIIALVVLVGVLIWKFREEIWAFLKWIGNAFYDYVINPIVNLFLIIWEFLTWIGNAFYDYVINPIVNLFLIIGAISYKYVVKPFLKFMGMLFNGIKKGFKMVVDFFISIFVTPIRNLFGILKQAVAPITEALAPVLKGVSEIFDKIKLKLTTVFGSIADVIKDMFKWFEGVSTFGGWDWINMDDSKKDAYLKKKAELEQNAYVQAAEKELTVEKAREVIGRDKFNQAQYEELLAIKKQNEKTPLTDLLAAQTAGILDLVDNVKNERKVRDAAMKFETNRTGTSGNTGT